MAYSLLILCLFNRRILLPSTVRVALPEKLNSTQAQETALALDTSLHTGFNFG